MPEQRRVIVVMPLPGQARAVELALRDVAGREIKTFTVDMDLTAEQVYSPGVFAQEIAEPVRHQLAANFGREE